MQRLAREMQRVAEDRMNGGEAGSRAEEMRRRAQEMFENSSPEQRQQMMDLAQRMAKEMDPSLQRELSGKRSPRQEPGTGEPSASEMADPGSDRSMIPDGQLGGRENGSSGTERVCYVV